MNRCDFHHLASVCLILALLLVPATSAAQEPDTPNWTTALVWNPDGNLIAVGTQYGSIRLVNTNGQTVRTLQENDGNPVMALAWSPNGLLLASGGANKQVTLWDVASGNQVASLAFSASVNGLSWHPDNIHLAMACTDCVRGNVTVWDTETEAVMFEIGISESFAVAWRPDGSLLAVGRFEEIQVWDPFASPAQRVVTLPTTPHYIVSLDWSSDGSRLASAQTITPERSVVNVWDMAADQLILTYGAHEDIIWSIAWSPDDRYLASASADGTVRIWDSTTGETIQVFEEANKLAAVDWHPSGERLIYGDVNGVIKTVDVPRR